MLSLKDLAKGEGRLSRKGYWLYFLAPGVGLVALTWLLLGPMFELLYGKAILILVFPWLLYVTITDGQNIRRYHDIGNSGRIYRLARPMVVVLPVLAFALQFIVPTTMASAGDFSALLLQQGQEIAGIWMTPTTIGLLGLVFSGIVLNALYLSLMPGQKGPNQYGPDPDGGAGIPLPGQSASQAVDDDPVKRALAEYQARQAQQTKPVAKASPAMVTPMRPAPSGGGFGKRRSS